MSAGVPGHSRGAWQWPLVVVPLLAAVGCGGPIGQVEGKISNRGQAVPRADIVFSLEGQPAEVFYGVSRDDGAYILDLGDRRGLTPGKYQVVVTNYVRADGSPLPAGEAGAALRGSDEAVSQRHSFTKEVAAGTNQIEIKLEDGQPIVPLQ